MTRRYWWFPFAALIVIGAPLGVTVAAVIHGDWRFAGSFGAITLFWAGVCWWVRPEGSDT